MFNANDTDHMVLSVHNDIIPHIREQAVANGETLGMRMAVCTENAIDRLKNNNYVFYVLRRDEDVRIKLTESLQAIFKSLRTQFLASDQFASLTKLTSREHRMLCDTFSNLMKSKKMPIGKAFTRKQLAVALHMSECDRLAKDVRMQQCNGSPRCGSPITPTVVGAEIVDLMPFASTSHVPDVENLRTPMRRSSTSNQLAVLAYPTPNSMPRRRGTSLCEAHSISLSATPQSRRMSLPMDEAEDQIATSSTIPTPSLSLLDVLPISEFLNWTSTSVRCSLGLVGLSTSNSQWIVSLVEKAKAITEASPRLSIIYLVFI
ncbi:hypothetical protein BDN70DRAFT_934109 [Pholiota conissans]|uniref:Uncharacterized protein n=1 Tax=Pholiota conissans TaxID=109636 RepID=A0A9P5YYW0_9AGAR|nr:hypothetical protein BDN70DRAFT_934109 [Pholiota conissans]